MILIRIIGKFNEDFIPLRDVVISHKYDTGMTSFMNMQGQTFMSVRIDYEALQAQLCSYVNSETGAVIECKVLYE